TAGGWRKPGAEPDGDVAGVTSAHYRRNTTKDEGPAGGLMLTQGWVRVRGSLALDGAGGQAADDITLHDDVEQHWRQGKQHRSRQDALNGCLHLRAEAGQADRG